VARKTFSIVILALFFILGRACANNLLDNPGFEIGSNGEFCSGGYAEGWSTWGCDGWFHSDSGKVISARGATIYHMETGIYQGFDAVAGKDYTFSIKMLHSQSDSPLDTHEAIFQAGFYNSAGQELFSTNVGSLKPTDPKDQWKAVEGTFTAPANTATGRIQFLINMPGTPTWGDKAFFDDASVEEVGGEFVADPDLDGNSSVNMVDLRMLLSKWLQVYPDYDQDGDDDVDLADFAVFSENWAYQPPPLEGYELLWNDEFDGSALDQSSWTYETGTGSNGWGNGEWQYYTSRSQNSRIENGSLVIEARKENYGGKNYTSARIKTQTKRSFQYGRIEARIKMPQGGAGIWPAFWMLGENITTPGVGWPKCGEIDIMEMFGNRFETGGALHFLHQGDPPFHHYYHATNAPVVDLSQDFHVYAIEWEQGQIKWYFDSSNFMTASSWNSEPTYPAPFNTPFFILLNFAVGDWYTTEDPTVPFPQQMLVDYVRVYEKTP
jgi:beta-glucanase (GH16 family)